jgi:PAS domain S-box-containing protein
VDREFFRSQALRLGFAEADYLAALDSVPLLSREAVETAMSFLMKLGHMISLLSYSNLKLARALGERDALTASLARSAESLRRAQEIAHVGSWELDLVNNSLSWSDEVYRIFGLQPQEFGATYEAFLAAVHPDDRAAVDAAYSGSLREGKSSYEITHRVVRRNTCEVRWVHEKCEHLRGADGALLRSTGMVQDITERRLAEEKVLQASQLRHLALEATEMGAWDFRLDTGEVYWDGRCRDMFGVAAGEQIDYTEAISRIHPEDRAATDDAVKQAIAGDSDGAYQREFRVIWPDGSVHWVASHGRVYFEGQGRERRAVRFIGANMDITERKRTEENLRQAQKLESIGLLAGGIAHDFNNLLVGVIGNASLAQDMIPSGSPALKMLSRIMDAGEQAANLTRQMLAYAGKGRFVLEPVNLSALVRSTSALMQSSISKKIDWQFQLRSAIPAVESDPGQMQQVLMNLVFNASEAIGAASVPILLKKERFSSCQSL